VSFSQWRACTIRIAGRPAQYSLAGRRLLEVDDQPADLDRTAPRIGVHDNARGDRGGEAEVIGGRQAVHQHAHLVPSRHRVQHVPVVGCAGLPGKGVRAGHVVQPPIDPAELAAAD
jgi:hypothetical protein